MDIPNEIKLKVALQYYGCDFLSCYNIENNPVIQPFVRPNTDPDLYEPDFENKRDLLILKPLSAITDEDGIKTLKILYPHIEKEANIGEIRYLFKEFTYLEGKVYCNPEKTIQVYQCLQNLGYDLPHYLLEGKTLHEAGLAIYKEHLKTT